MALPKSKLKVLCLHGYKQHAKAFKNRTNALRKSLKNNVEFTYITAPILIKFDENKSNNNNKIIDGIHYDHKSKVDNDIIEYLPKSRTWWVSSDNNTKYIGLRETLIYVINILNKCKFDGILGFSQGSILAIILCLLKDNNDILKDIIFDNDSNNDSDIEFDKNILKIIADIKLDKNSVYMYDFRFVWLFSGFIPNDLYLKKYFDLISNDKMDQINTKCLIISGKNDEVTSFDKTKNVCNYFKNCKFIEHNGGHYCPTDKTLKKEYISFFENV